MLSNDDRRIGSHFMQNILRSIVTAFMSGLVFFLGSVFILMQVGISRHGNYEYYGKYWFLYVVPGVIGFVLPTIVAWLCYRKKELD